MKTPRIGQSLKRTFAVSVDLQKRIHTTEFISRPTYIPAPSRMKYDIAFTNCQHFPDVGALVQIFAVQEYYFSGLSIQDLCDSSRPRHTQNYKSEKRKTNVVHPHTHIHQKAHLSTLYFHVNLKVSHFFPFVPIRTRESRPLLLTPVRNGPSLIPMNAKKIIIYVPSNRI